MKFSLASISVLTLINQISGNPSEFVSKNDANSLLSVPDSYVRNGRGLTSKSIKSIKEEWNTVCKFNSVEKWIEFKDELEDTVLPEKEVDSLERCTSKCYWKDQAKDFVGNAYEEKREDQEEESLTFSPACIGCFAKVPKTFMTGFQFVQVCKNK